MSKRSRVFECNTNPSNFCYMCGEYVSEKNKRCFSPKLRDSFEESFNLKVSNIDERWTPSALCQRCYVQLSDSRRSRNLSEKKRRDQFNSLVNDLSALISTTNRKMDKSTVLKSTIAFLKHHNEATDRSKVFEIQQDWKPSFLSNDEFTQLMLESLDGFIIVFGSRGPIFYTSDSVTAQLGYLPCDLMKMTIFDLSYEMDHENLLNIFLNPKPVIEPTQTDICTRNQISFFLHLKRGGIEDRDSNSYELVKFVGYFRNDANVDVGGDTQTSLPHVLQRNTSLEVDNKLIFVGTGRLQMPQMIREITVTDPTCNEFTSKHSMEWKFLFLDHRAPPIIGYMPFEVLGTSGYDYYHFDDIDDLVTCHEELMQAGKGKSSYYRFLTKGQQWIWLQTEFYISYNQFNAKPDYVVCTHKVINYTDIMKYHKLSSHQKSSSTSASLPAANSHCKSTTLPSRDLTLPNNTPADSLSITGAASTAAVTPTAAATTTSNNVITVSSTNNLCNNVSLLGDIISNETSPSMDTSAMWTNPPTPTGAGTCHLQPLKSHSRAASSYGNISSTGISPNMKRKRYMYNCRGNESDSTSMSADSGTSRQSLMTHMSSSRQRLASGVLQSNFSSVHHQQPSAPSNQHHSHMQHQHQHLHQHHHHQHQEQQQQQQQQHLMHMNSQSGQVQNHGQKMSSALPQHAIVTSSPIAGTAACQFTQPAFPIRSQQIVTPSFIESSQYLAAIPVQPVIAPFQVAPVISPLPTQNEMIAGPVVMTSTQSHLQEQLQRKHDELQKLIIQQQDELRIVSEQLLLARYTLLQPMMTMNYGQTETGAMGNTTRNYNFNHDAVQQQFNQYGFAMNSSEMQQQHMMMQQQQNLQQQIQQNHAHQQHQQSTNQQQHMQQSNVQQSTQQQQQQQQLHHQQQHQQHDQILLNRNIPDLDQFAQEEFDAFLNLSPLHNMGGSQTALNQINTSPTSTTPTTNHNIQSTTSTNNNNNPSANNVNLIHTTPFKPSSNNPPNSSEDSLFSYMQIAATSSPTLNFPMNINDGAASETQSDDSKILPSTSSNHQQHHQMPDISPTQPQRQQQRSPFFPAHPFLSIAVSTQSPNANNSNAKNSAATANVNSSGNNNPLSNELSNLLPYQLDPEQSQNLFNSNSHTGRANQ